MKIGNFLKGRNIWYLGLALLAILAAFLILPRFNSANASEAAADTSATVVALDLAETVEASGSLEARPSAVLKWNTSGVVDEVYVQSGDRVSEGDVLMKLKTTSVAANIISAQADLANAQQALDDLLSSSDTELAQAVIELKDAREAYEEAEDYLVYLQNSEKVPQTETRVYLQSSRNSWKYQYKTKTFKGPAPEDWIVEAANDLALKKGEYEDAQYAYDRVKDGPNKQDLLAAQASVDAAQATVDSMSVIAPFSGEVLYVESQPGDVVGSTTTAIYLADLDRLYVETMVDEADIAKIKVGNPITATLDAVPGVTLAGEVAAINPVGEEVSGLVKYTVLVGLHEMDEQVFLPLGTTVNVTIQVKEASSVLAVPMTTIQNDSQGEYVLLLQGDGTTRRVAVVSGAIHEDLVAVRGELKAGDRLSTRAAQNDTFSGPFGKGE